MKYLANKHSHKRKLILDHPGFVIYDLSYLKQFVQEHKIKETNLLEYFRENNDIGGKALSQGVITPVYSIEPTYYDVYITVNDQPQLDHLESIYTYDNFPFKVTSGKIELTTIVAILYWEDDNFEEYDDPNIRGDAFLIEIPSGNYTLRIKGYHDKKTDTKMFELIFNSTEKLPPFRKELQNCNFNIK